MSFDNPLPSSTIARLLKEEVKPIFLLGAGASVRSGIPLSGALVEEIAKWGYCKTYDREIDDPTLMRSDWLPWFLNQSWYRNDHSFSDNYPRAVEHVLKPRANRKEFFKRVLHPGVPPSSGYVSMAQLLARKVVKTILTTNFDQLLADAARSIPGVHALEEIKTKDDYKMFSTNPKYPQIVYIHGSVEHYTDKNIEKETDELDYSLVELLGPVLRDHPLVVVGYRGSEPSVMQHLLMGQRDFCQGFRHGIYWCQLKNGGEEGISPLLVDFHKLIGSNFQFVEIDGFDELIGSLNNSLPNFVESDHDEGEIVSDKKQEVHDLVPANCSFDDLNDVLLSSKLLAYAEAVRLPRPDLSSAIKIAGSAADRGLSVFRHGAWIPTNSGLLLFAKNSDVQFQQASIEVCVKGGCDWVSEILDRRNNSYIADNDEKEERLILHGDLWGQLEQSIDILARVNKPFRLKGVSSKDVYRYPPLALKELLTNMIAHRDYGSHKKSILFITPGEIRFENPGGLVEHVRKQLNNQEIQSAVNSNVHGIKGYRNPVIADFFFSAGAMDKKGSGLPDVINEASNNLNEVQFGPDADNSAFLAVIRCRPEAAGVDANTQTARPALAGELRYSPNLLGIIQWPDYVWKIGTLSSAKDFGVTESNSSPPFAVNKNWIWTFESPDRLCDTPLMSHIYEDEIHKVSSIELLGESGAGFSIPRLLNMALAKYLVSLGLKIKQEPGRIRAYFSDCDGGSRQVTYRGRFKQATRTVAKPIISRSTGKTIYWEHKAVSLKFEKFGGGWYLSLVPCYVFTVDGDSQPIASERIGPLSTRRSSKDYNQTVLHDLVFWARIISGEVETNFEMPVSGAIANKDAKAISLTIEIESKLPIITFQEQIDANMASVIEGESDISEEEQLKIQETIERIIEESTKSEESSGN